MGRPRKHTGMMVAKEAFVWVEGARPVTYEQIEVVDRKTGQLVTMNSDRIIDQGSDGIPHTVKPYQRMPANSKIVLAKPAYFVPEEDLDPSEADLVVTR